MSRKTRSISFSLDDPFEEELYRKSLEIKNFSKLMKRLFENHINVKNEPTKVVPISQPTNPTVDKEYLRQLI